MGATEESLCFRLRRRVYRGRKVSVWLRRRVDGDGRISVWLRRRVDGGGRILVWLRRMVDGGGRILVWLGRRVDGGETILFYARFSIDDGGNFGFLRAELLAFGRLSGVRALAFNSLGRSFRSRWFGFLHLTQTSSKKLGGTYYAE